MDPPPQSPAAATPVGGALCPVSPRAAPLSALDMLKVECAVPSCKLMFIRQGKVKFGAQLEVGHTMNSSQVQLIVDPEMSVICLQCCKADCKIISWSSLHCISNSFKS